MIPWNDTELKWTAGRKKMQKMDRLEKKRDFKSKREGKIKCLRRGWLVAKSVVRTLKPVIYFQTKKNQNIVISGLRSQERELLTCQLSYMHLSECVIWFVCV